MTVRIYELTRRFPAEEKFGITSQMRRASSSIPANIAEGQARRSTGEFLQSLGIARGSLAELENLPDLIRKAGSDAGQGLSDLVERLRRDKQNAQRADALTIHSPLTTNHWLLVTVNGVDVFPPQHWRGAQRRAGGYRLLVHRHRLQPGELLRPPRLLFWAQATPISR